MRKKWVISSFFPFNSCDELPSCFSSSSSHHSHTLFFAHWLFFNHFSGFTTNSWGVGKGDSRAECHTQGMGELWDYKAEQHHLFCWILCSLCICDGCWTLFFKALFIIMARLLFLVAIGNLVATAACMASVVVFPICVTLLALPLWHKGRWNSRYHEFLQHFTVVLNTLKDFALLIRLIALVFTLTSQLWMGTIHNVSSSMTEDGKGQDLSFSCNSVRTHQY